jgi:hypothetical protein
MPRRHHHSFAWRATKAIEHAAASRPLLSRTGPAWMFGVIGVVAELFFAPVILVATFVVGMITYMLLDTPWARVRARQRPRFVSVRILYLNTLMLAGLWLAVMFTFSAADPQVSAGLDLRLPRLLEVATTHDLHALIKQKVKSNIKPVTEAVGEASTWFDVFLHGFVSALALNFLLYGVVIARRRLRSRHRMQRAARASLRYDRLAGLFVNEDSGVAR